MIVPFFIDWVFLENLGSLQIHRSLKRFFLVDSALENIQFY
jgi:hypothetical protein